MAVFLTHPPLWFCEHLIYRKRRSAAFVVLTFFLLAFVISRAYTYAAMAGIVPGSLTQNINGVHVHHFAWGILIIAIVGLINLLMPIGLIPRWRLKLAAVYGWGLGFTFDEFGMWLHLRDDYWLRQSYDAIVVISGLMINLIYFAKFWRFILAKLTARKD